MANSGSAAVLMLAIMLPVLARAQAKPPDTPVPPRPPAAAMPEIHIPQPASQPAAQPVVRTATSPVMHNSTAAVDYSSGQLTVVSDSASLAFVLKLVGAKTGAVVDIAPELQSEPVAARLGPAPVREVLTGLLDSPRIDYIVMGTGDEPGSLKRIVVRTRQSFGQLAMAPIRPPQPHLDESAEEEKLDQSGHLLSNAPEDKVLSQQQLMENWKKARAEMIQAEIKQQAADRESEKTQPPDPPVPQDNPPAENPPANPPLLR
jgi:hypothetical protein